MGAWYNDAGFVKLERRLPFCKTKEEAAMSATEKKWRTENPPFCREQRQKGDCIMVRCAAVGERLLQGYG